MRFYYKCVFYSYHVSSASQNSFFIIKNIENDLKVKNVSLNFDKLHSYLKEYGESQKTDCVTNHNRKFYNTIVFIYYTYIYTANVKFYLSAGCVWVYILPPTGHAFPSRGVPGRRFMRWSTNQMTWQPNRPKRIRNTFFKHISSDFLLFDSFCYLGMCLESPFL